jgi:hypothetical protein
MEELRQQTQDVLHGKPAQPKIFPNQVSTHACILTHAHTAQHAMPLLLPVLHAVCLQPVQPQQQDGRCIGVQ